MTLLSPLALLFGLAALVPLLLHLYQRRQRVVVLFSTNRFFTRSVVRSQRRLRLRRVLLLVLRMAACVLFAMALARPILALAGLTGTGTGNRDMVIVLDDSLSMQAADSKAWLAGGAATAPRPQDHGTRAPSEDLPQSAPPSTQDSALRTTRLDRAGLPPWKSSAR